MTAAAVVPLADNAKYISPRKVKEKQVVSIAGIFKKRSEAPFSSKRNPLKLHSSDAQDQAEDRPKKRTRFAADVKTIGWHANSSSPQRAEPPEAEVLSSKTSEMHPLSLSFNDTTIAYRANLYKAAVNAINATHAHFTQQLHLSTTRTSSDADNLVASPFQISIWAKLEESSRVLNASFGGTMIKATPKNPNGGIVEAPQELDEKMAAFEMSMVNHEKEFNDLTRSWQKIVKEIWHVGVQALGEDTMRDMLLPQPVVAEELDHEEEPLFVANDEDDVKKPKPKVSFQEPVPQSLAEPSCYRSPLKSIPEIPMADVGDLEATMNELGDRRMEELRELDEESQKWWQRKHQKMAAILQAG
ncbi:hypothetical protein EJ04DRAFT_126754 [Polyplosphaeria fusca]|uniref:Uncharacterized protein n=1 Tax=Polyplosphaeria fusca TaxID=682080 RepID=A0A9P4V2F8_9PLEO|nr:hypothetical protein EJ04DRAFT_126754 [Polyplosphaeria fusca]